MTKVGNFTILHCFVGTGSQSSFTLLSVSFLARNLPLFLPVHIPLEYFYTRYLPIFLIVDLCLICQLKAYPLLVYDPSIAYVIYVFLKFFCNCESEVGYFQAQPSFSVFKSFIHDCCETFILHSSKSSLAHFSSLLYVKYFYLIH